MPFDTHSEIMQCDLLSEMEFNIHPSEWDSDASRLETRQFLGIGKLG